MPLAHICAKEVANNDLWCREYRRASLTSDFRSAHRRRAGMPFKNKAREPTHRSISFGSSPRSKRRRCSHKNAYARFNFLRPRWLSVAILLGSALAEPSHWAARSAVLRLGRVKSAYSEVAHDLRGPSSAEVLTLVCRPGTLKDVGVTLTTPD